MSMENLDEVKIREIIKKVLRDEPEIILNIIRERGDFLIYEKAKDYIKEEIGDLKDKVATKDEIKMLIEFINARFEDVNRRFEDNNRRFEDMNRRFEDINKRFEDMNRRIEFIEKILILLLGINIINTGTVIMILLKVMRVF